MIFASFFDPLILLSVSGLASMSLFLLASTAANLVWSQTAFFLFGVSIFIIFASIDYRVWLHFRWYIYFASLVLLISIFFVPQTRGVNRWFNIAGINIQPSELLKPFMIIVISSFLSEKRKKDLVFFLKSVFAFLPIVLLIFKQPDLGNVLVYIAIFANLLIVSNLPWKYILSSVLGLSFFLPLAWFFLKSYQKLRLVSFINPYTDPIGAGYNALQSMIAIGSGQFFGLGLGRGSQSRLLFLPEYHTDFVFAALIEALGLLGGIFIIFFYSLLLCRILWIAFTVKNEYARLVSIGIFSQFFAQVFINVGMNLGILPITGITLPLISYGGSSIVSTFIGLGLIVSIAKSQKEQLLVIR